MDIKAVMTPGLGSNMNYPDPARLKTPQMDGPSNTPDQRVIEVDFTQSLTEILARIPGLSVDPQLGIDVISNCTDSWMAAMKSRQNSQDERLERFHGSIMRTAM